MVTGSCWQDPLAVAGTTGRPVCRSRDRASGRRALSVVCVLGREPAACPALHSLRDACRHLRARLHTLPFGTLALGDTGTLDRFYNAGEDATHAAGGIPGVGFLSPSFSRYSAWLSQLSGNIWAESLPSPCAAPGGALPAVCLGGSLFVFLPSSCLLSGVVGHLQGCLLGVKHAGVISERVVFVEGLLRVQPCARVQAGAPHRSLRCCDGRGHPLF